MIKHSLIALLVCLTAAACNSDKDAADGDSDDQQLQAEHPGHIERNPSRWDGPVGSLVGVDFDVVHVVEHHAGRVEQDGGDRQEEKRANRLRRAVHHHVTHRHVGDGRKDVRQAKQLEIGEHLWLVSRQPRMTSRKASLGRSNSFTGPTSAVATG